MKRLRSRRVRALGAVAATLAIVAGGLLASQRASFAVSGITSANIQELDGTIDFTGNTAAYGQTSGHDVAIEKAAPYDWSSLFTGCTSASDPCATGNGEPSDNGVISTNGAACQVGSCAGLIADVAQPYTGDLFTQGSKDVQDPSAWTCTQQSNQPKDELVNTYASAWTAPATAGSVLQGDTVAFMGLERPNTKGDSNAGFWLFKQKVICNPTTGKFSGTHSKGDVFLVGSFVSGGTSAVLNQYTWNCTTVSATDPTCASATGTLTLSTSGALNCPDDSASTTFCQVVNQQTVGGTTTNWTVKTPWSNIDTGTNGIAGPGFLEIGIDLSKALNTAGATAPCFASFLADTRSSGSSTQAETKDFINGNFPTCGNLSVKKYIDKDLDPNAATGNSGDIANGPDASDYTGPDAAGATGVGGWNVAVTNATTTANLCTGTTSATDGSLSCTTGSGLSSIPNGTPLNVTETVPSATAANVSPAPATNPTPTYFNTDPGVVGTGDVSGLQGTTVTKSATMGSTSQTIYVGNECFVNFEFDVTGAPTGTTTPQGITVSYTVNSGNYNGTAPNSGSISLQQASTGSATWTGMVKNYLVQNDNITWTWTATDFSGNPSSSQTGATISLTTTNGYPSCHGSSSVAFTSPVLGGIKFKDANHDGTQDNYTDLTGASVPEPLLSGFTMTLYTGSTCAAANAVTTAVSASTADTNGFNYSFGQQSPGNYSVKETAQMGWTQTAPLDASHAVETCVPFTANLGDATDGPDAIGNTPLTDLTVTVTGETSSTASKVSCTNTTSGSANTHAATTSDPGSVNTNSSTGLQTGTYTCTVQIIDP